MHMKTRHFMKLIAAAPLVGCDTTQPRKSRENLIEQAAGNINWQWTNYFDITDQALFDRDLEKLKEGQSHDGAAPVQELYVQAFAFVGYEEFWRVVASASGIVPSDFNTAAAHIIWQSENNIETLRLALGYYRGNQGWKAMATLQLGQAHPEGAIARAHYRACYRDNPKHLFEIVSQHV